MELRYDEETKARLRQWRDADPKMYEATARHLEGIKADPSKYSREGMAYVPRLFVYGVDGRDDEYAITWNPNTEPVLVISVSTIDELKRRAAFGSR